MCRARAGNIEYTWANTDLELTVHVFSWLEYPSIRGTRTLYFSEDTDRYRTSKSWSYVQKHIILYMTPLNIKDQSIKH